MEDEMDAIKRKEAFKKSLDLDRIRGGLNKMIDERMLQRGAP
jgi:arylsulfatase